MEGSVQVTQLTNAQRSYISSLLDRGQGMGYTQKWWAENREKINSRRNEKYKDDAVYRDNAKIRAQAYRQVKRKERLEQEANATLDVGGKVVKAWSTDRVCVHADISPSRIKYMQRAGYIPNALVTRPVRLYTQRQAQLIKTLEMFLRANQTILKGTTTPQSIKVAARLAALTSDIADKWET